jgi:DNA-binding NtrC family response regulator
MTSRILVADDEPEILLEMTSYLRRRGHFVMNASSIGEATRLYLEWADSIALVVTDMTMSDGNGCDLARLVHERSKGQCPCLIISGNFDSDGLPADLGAAGILSLAKPFSLSMFYAAVLTILQGPTGMSAAGLGVIAHSPGSGASI